MVPLHDLQRRPGGEVPRVLQMLGVNIQDNFEAALLEFLLLIDQPVALIESESYRNLVKALKSRVTTYKRTTLTRPIQAAFKKNVRNRRIAYENSIETIF